MGEVNKLISSGSFREPTLPPGMDKMHNLGSMIPSNEPNYVIDKLWYTSNGSYMYAVVTDLHKEQLYILSRLPNPPLCHYDMIMNHVVQNYDRDRLVQTPHYH